MSALEDPRAEILVAEFLLDFDIEQAAERVGIPVATAKTLIKKPEVKQRLRERGEITADAVGVSVGYVLATIRDTVERCRRAEPVYDSEGHDIGEYRFDASNVMKGCELLGKHLRMFVDRVEVDQRVSLETLVMQSIRMEAVVHNGANDRNGRIIEHPDEAGDRQIAAPASAVERGDAWEHASAPQPRPRSRPASQDEIEALTA